MNASQSAAMRLAHVTDLHLPLGAPPALAALAGKRALGYLSWLRRRRRLHQPWASLAVFADIRAQACEAALISGDVVNIALPSEFEAASRWLEEALAGLPAALAPGNHDAYVRTRWEETLGRLAPFMTGLREGESAPRAAQGFEDFPYIFQPSDGEISVIAANSSPPTAPGLATGALGARQIAGVEKALRRAGEDGRFRILMLHHPVEPGVVSSRKALTDAPALRAAIARAGVELVLHGHAHRAHVGAVDTPTGPAPVLGGGSASHPYGHGRYRPGHYNLIEIARTGPLWSIGVSVREIDPETRSIGEVERHMFERPAREAAAV